MAKVTITFEDGDDDKVQVSTVFDPPIEDEEDMTDAQHGAATAIQAVLGIAADGYTIEEYDTGMNLLDPSEGNN